MRVLFLAALLGTTVACGVNVNLDGLGYAMACNPDFDEGSMTARVAGQDFADCSTNVAMAGNQLSLYGITSDEDGSNPILIGFVVKSAAVGEHQLGVEGEGNSGYCYVGSQDRFDTRENAGTVTITRLDDASIEGTFHFSAFNQQTVNQVEVSDGQFSVELQ